MSKSQIEIDIEREVREKVAQEIETELAALQRHRENARSEREERAYRTSAHIARGGACVANPKGVDLGRSGGSS